MTQSKDPSVTPVTKAAFVEACRGRSLYDQAIGVVVSDERQRLLQDLYASINRCADIDAGRLACRVAIHIEGADIELCQQVVLKRGTADHAVDFACRVPGANLFALEQKVLTDGDAQAAYWFARQVASSDRTALQARICQLKDAQTAAFFARDVPGADQAVLERLVLDEGSARDVLAYAAGVAGAHTQPLQQVFEQRIKAPSQMHLCVEFALQVPDSDVVTLAALAQKGGELFEFAKKLSHSTRFDEPAVGQVLGQMQDWVVSHCGCFGLLTYAKDVRGADVGLLYQAASDASFAGLGAAHRKLFKRLADHAAAEPTLEERGQPCH